MQNTLPALLIASFHTFQIYSSFCVDLQVDIREAYKIERNDIFKWDLLSKPVKQDKSIKANKTLSAFGYHFGMSNGIGTTWLD